MIELCPMSSPAKVRTGIPSGYARALRSWWEEAITFTNKPIGSEVGKFLAEANFEKVSR